MFLDSFFNNYSRISGPHYRMLLDQANKDCDDA